MLGTFGHFRVMTGVDFVESAMDKESRANDYAELILGIERINQLAYCI
jgi:hypothetical protein